MIRRQFLKLLGASPLAAVLPKTTKTEFEVGDKVFVHRQDEDKHFVGTVSEKLSKKQISIPDDKIIGMKEFYFIGCEKTDQYFDDFNDNDMGSTKSDIISVFVALPWDKMVKL